MTPEHPLKDLLLDYVEEEHPDLSETEQLALVSEMLVSKDAWLKRRRKIAGAWR